jgi:5-methylthioadenosine/S-adenosylhomocysteine deaminase
VSAAVDQPRSAGTQPGPAAASEAAPSPGSAGVLLIRDVTAVPMVRRGEVLERTDLLLVDGRIAALGPTGTLATPTDRPVVVLEGRGRLALPGFVNAHSHAGLALLKASAEAMPLEPWLSWLIPVQARMTPDDLYWSTQLACLEQIRHGITTFADMLALQAACAPAIEAAGLRAVLSASVMESDPTAPIMTPGLERLERSVEFAQAWDGRAGGRVRARLAAHSVYTVRPALLRAFAERSAETGLGLQIHCAETRTEVRGCLERHGRTPVGLLADSGFLERPVLLAHAVHLTDDDIQLADRPWVGISHNPGSNLKLQSGLARLPDLLGRRLAVGLGSDSAASNDTLDLLKEAYLAAVLHPWAPDSAPSWLVLELATIGGARALGLEREIGSLEPGKRADLILVERSDPRQAPGLDPVRQLIYTGRGSDVTTTIVDGVLLMDEGRVRGLEVERIWAECRSRGRRLLSA